MIVLRKAKDGLKSILIVPTRNEHTAVWEGPQPTTTELASRYGVDDVVEIDQV